MFVTWGIFTTSVTKCEENLRRRRPREGTNKRLFRFLLLILFSSFAVVLKSLYSFRQQLYVRFSYRHTNVVTEVYSQLSSPNLTKESFDVRRSPERARMNKYLKENKRLFRFLLLTLFSRFAVILTSLSSLWEHLTFSPLSSWLNWIALIFFSPL